MKEKITGDDNGLVGFRKKSQNKLITNPIKNICTFAPCEHVSKYIRKTHYKNKSDQESYLDFDQAAKPILYLNDPHALC